MNAIELNQLSKSFGSRVALHRVSLAVPSGSIFGYLGLNGAGKSTTVRVLTTLVEPSSGSAHVAGHDVTLAPARVRESIGFVGEVCADVFATWTPEEYVRFFAGLRGLDERSEPERVLSELELDEVKTSTIGALSTGMRRRVDIARALLGRPPVLLLDEPTRGLDLPARIRMWDKLRGIVRDNRTTIFLTSHDAREIRALCESIAIINKGRISFSGPASKLGANQEEFEASLVHYLEKPVHAELTQVIPNPPVNGQ